MSRSTSGADADVAPAAAELAVWQLPPPLRHVALPVPPLYTLVKFGFQPERAQRQVDQAIDQSVANSTLAKVSAIVSGPLFGVFLLDTSRGSRWNGSR